MLKSMKVMMLLARPTAASASAISLDVRKAEGRVMVMSSQILGSIRAQTAVTSMHGFGPAYNEESLVLIEHHNEKRRRRRDWGWEKYEGANFFSVAERKADFHERRASSKLTAGD